MPDRAACERRVYRLAAILTGDPIKATKVITQVVGAKPNLADLDSAHMDRLTVLRSREIRPATLVSEHVPLEIAAALQGLPAQQREAWVLARVYQTPPREMSRAMDCSSTAAERHLHAASAGMAHAVEATGGSDAAAARAFLQYSMTLDVPEFYRAAQRRRRRVRLAALLTVIGALALVIAALAMWWSRPFDGREAPGAGPSGTTGEVSSPPATPPTR